MTSRINILIADDHPLFRRGLREVVRDDPRFHLVAEAGTGQAVLHILDREPVDILLLDIRLPDISGFEVVRRMQCRRLTTTVVFLTMYRDEDRFNEAMGLGVMGYVLKESAPMEVLDGLHQVAQGRHYVSREVAEYLFPRKQGQARLLAETPQLKALTPAESKVLQLVARNLTSKQIASSLCLSVRTIESHRLRICQKLALRGTHSLVKYALDNRFRL